MSFDFVHFHVRLLRQHAGRTAVLGAYAFTDGVSVRKLHRNEAQLLAGIGFACEAIDENGDAVFEVVPGKVPMDAGSMKAEPVREHKAEAGIKGTKADVLIADDIQQPAPAVTREQLEAIADKSGLKGLREIGNKFGIKGKSIPELIARILQKQG